jgi:hypothetical protein
VQDVLSDLLSGGRGGEGGRGRCLASGYERGWASREDELQMLGGRGAKIMMLEVRHRKTEKAWTSSGEKQGRDM